MRSFEIMFSDLNENAQKRFLEFQEVKSEKEGNFEVSPIAIIYSESNEGDYTNELY